MTEMFSGIRNEEIRQIAVFAVSLFPLDHRPHVDAVKLIVHRISQEAQVARLKQAIYLVVAGIKRQPFSVFEMIAPDLRVAPVVVIDRRVKAAELPPFPFTVPRL